MNKNSKRTIAGGAVACLIMTAVPAIPAVAAGTTDLAGSDRIQTAIKIAEASWNGAWKDSKIAVLASGNDANLVDALAVAPLAYAKQAPILLSRDSKDAVDAATLKEITDRKVEKVYLAAGTGVLSDKIVDQLKAAGVKEIVRLGGLNRYETAKNINKELGAYTKVAVVNGEVGLADALSVASIAANQGMAIVMTSNKDAAPADDLTGKTVYAIGGSGVISDSVVSKLSATRFGGNTRYETNAKVIEGLKSNVKFDTIYLADGNNEHLVDSLTGSVLAAQTASPVVLADSSLDAKQKEVLQGALTKDTKVQTFGGTVSSSVKDAVNKIINPTTTPDNNGDATVKIDSVSVLNLKQIKVTFASAVTDSSLKDEVEDTSNYTLKDKDDDEVKDVIKKVKLDDSKKFAIITFEDQVNDKDKYIIENNQNYKLVVDSVITGGKSDYEAKLDMTDKDFPTIKDMTAVGVDTIKVTFSEPMQPDNLKEVAGSTNVKGTLDKDNFKIYEMTDGKEGSEISINRVELVNDNTEANIVVSSDLKDKQDLNVRVSGSNTDYAGLTAPAKVQKVSVKEDKNEAKVVGYKDVEANKATLIFDKDVKFQDSDDLIADTSNNSGILEDFYLAGNENNNPSKVEADGKNLILTFPDSVTIPDGESKIYIKSDTIKSLWNVKNSKVTASVKRDTDNTKPTVVKVEQDEDDAYKIHVKFSEKVKLDDNKDGGAKNTNNYVVKDSNGNEKTVSEITEDGDNQREFVLKLSEKLEDATKYSITIKNVEDTAGNSIAETTKDITAVDKDGVKLSDMKVHLYSTGDKDQKITVDYDKKMKTGKLDANNPNTIEALSKYTLVCKDNPTFFEGKDSINLANFYKSEAKVKDDGKLLEIKLPYKDSESKSYNLGMINPATQKPYQFEIQVSAVEDANGVVVTRTLVKDLTTPDGIDFDGDAEFTDVDTIHIELTAKTDNFAQEDFVFVAANNETDAKNAALQNKDLVGADGKAITHILRSANSKPAYNSDDNEDDLYFTLKTDDANPAYDKDLSHKHVIDNDAKYSNTRQDVYVVTVANKTVNGQVVTGTKDEYGNRLVSGKVGRIVDSIAPSVLNNRDRSDSGIWLGSDNAADKNAVKNSWGVEYWQAKDANGNPSIHDAALVITFEEPIDPAYINKGTFDVAAVDEFHKAIVKDEYVNPNNPKQVVIELDQVRDGDTPIAIHYGMAIQQKGMFKDMPSGDNNVNANKINVSIGNFPMLKNDPRRGHSNTNVAVTGITLPTTGNVAVGATTTLTPVIAPANATNQSVTWTSSDTTVATVANGVVTGVKAGTATITATTVDGNKVASTTVTVAPAGALAVVKVSPFNILTGGTTVTVNDVTKVKTITVDGTDVTKSALINATTNTITVFVDGTTAPASIVLVDNAGNTVKAK